MAKRKRLTPAKPDYFGAGFHQGARAPETKSMPLPGPAPIAQVAGEAAASAALAQLAETVGAARAEGRMIETLPLAAIDERYLVRDRLEQDEDELRALIDSIRGRGQQAPIEVIALPGEPAGSAHGSGYGLISGWRRLTALRRLHAQTGADRFATVRALVIAPESAQAAYVAMVEENEIRVNLSLYERARIAIRAVQEGVYPTPRTALQGLYAATTRSKRSKIGTFIGVVEALDSVLNHPAAIPEKLGLALARALQDDPDLAEALRVRLRQHPRDSAEDELGLLAAAARGSRRAPAPDSGSGADPAPPARPRLRSAGGETAANERLTKRFSPGLQIQFTPGQNRLELTGTAVNNALYEALQDWLKTL